MEYYKNMFTCFKKIKRSKNGYDVTKPIRKISSNKSDVYPEPPQPPEPPEPIQPKKDPEILKPTMSQNEQPKTTIPKDNESTKNEIVSQPTIISTNINLAEDDNSQSVTSARFKSSERQNSSASEKLQTRSQNEQPKTTIPKENESTKNEIVSQPTIISTNINLVEDDNSQSVTSARFKSSKQQYSSASEKSNDPDEIKVEESANANGNDGSEIEIKESKQVEFIEPKSESNEETKEPTPESEKEIKPESKPKPESSSEQTKERRGGVRQTAKIDTTQKIKTYSKTDEEIGQIKRAILTNEFLEIVLRGEVLNTIVAAMYLREVNEKEVIIEEGEEGDHMYVSSSGTYEVYLQNKLEGMITGNKVFGELAILYNAKRMAKIRAGTKGQVWVLPREVYQRALIQHAIKDQEETLSFLQKVPLINGLKREKLQKIANLLRREFFKTDTVIIREGDRGDKFYIIRAGSVTVTKLDEGKVAELGRGAFFGELALRQEERRQATVIADTPGVECLTLTRAEFNEHFDDSIWVTSSEGSRKESAKKSRSKIFSIPLNEFTDIKLKHLKKVETLGVGGFGRVDLVQYTQNEKLTFALKYLKKIDMVQQGQVDHVFNEKEIQISCESTFIVRMYNTFKDHKYLYFLMESCLGGDLWTYLQKQKDRHVEDISGRFYAGCVLEALTYLHDRDCVFRDLKPENLLLSTNGYLKLTDFGFAKHIGPRGKTFTFAGTPEYVAPEIIYNRGHDKSVDYWALGIFIFELLAGKTPFRSDDPSHMKTYNRILRGINSIHFPQHFSRSATNIILKLCKPSPIERLGAQKNGIQDIRNHKWFQGFDWHKLKNQTLKAPYVPKLSSNTDTRHFEKFRRDDDIPPDEVSGFDSTF